MEMEKNHRPTESDAKKIVSHFLGTDQFSLKRFTTGLCHYVYEVTPRSSEVFVLRMGYSDTREYLAGSVYWNEQLLPVGIPIPEILFKDLSGPFPYTILSRIPGQDLGDVYHLLNSSQKKALAREIVHWQNQVAKPPLGNGYGFGFSAKNVMVSKQQLSGIVDIDDVCYGDSLLVIALTRMALLSQRQDTDYILFWCDMLELSDEQMQALNFYTALFCVTFMGEIGQKFNRETVEIDRSRIEFFEAILDKILK